MAKQKIKDIVARELESFLAENGYELYNVEFVKEGKDWFLRVYADLAGGDEENFIGTQDCEKISRYLSERLDEMDPIEQNYYLEVSSPGMDRQLLTEEHYLRYVGKQVEVRLYKQQDGCRQINGILEGLKDGKVIVTDENDRRWELPLEGIAKTNLAVVF